MDKIGIFLAQVRERAGLTQADVATLRHSSRGTQSQLELSSANPRWSTIEEFAVAIGARVTMRFDLFNGEVAEFVSGLAAPNLLETLDRERAQLKKDARFESLVAGRLAEAVEPTSWARQSAVRVLVGAAIGENLHGQALFVDDFDLGHWEDDAGNWKLDGRNFIPDPVSVVELNRVLLRRLCEEVARLVKSIEEEREGLYLAVTPTPAFTLYVKDGAPAARSVADQLIAIVEDPVRCDRVLAAMGFLPSDPLAAVRERGGRA